jgi:maleate isomerase
MEGAMSAPFRVGLIVPSSNTTMETEVPAILRRRETVRRDERFTFHSARLRMQQVTAEELRAMNAQTARAASELADACPDVVATACLVAIMAQGMGYHCIAEEEIATVLAREDAAAPVVSSAGALIEALHELGALRIAMVAPYVTPLTRLVTGYIEDAGIEVHDVVSLEVSDNRAVGRLDPAELHQHWRKLDIAGCDALVLSACVQMPSLSVIEAVEQDSGLPTLSAAIATTWSLLRAMRLEPTAPGAGALLAGPGKKAPDRA